ncbi:hypothetical protein LSM04_007298 [Trypanosoma melophagium]|uniref:uncharacterized protein n=1 Tax=Trypanosoma melophagium TaxID=715481 RepID=UPI00351AA491|nr:hypothetical protein LSM04_007298 [Trypanosoma melophagium]
MLAPQPFTEEHHEGRDGEEQQPRERTTSAAGIAPQDYSFPHEEDPQQQQQQQEEEVDWVRNGGRQRLDSRPAERRRTSTPQEVSPPLRLRVSKSPIGVSSARGTIHAAANETQENGPGRKSLSSRRSSPRVSTMTHPQNEKKRGVYARLVRDAARKFATRSPSRHTGSVGGKSPSRGLESGRYGHRSAATADSTVTATATLVATVPPSTSGGTSVSPEPSRVGMGLTVGYNHEEGGEVMSTHIPIVVRNEGLFTSSARRIVQQAEPIQRHREPNTGSASASGGHVGGLSKRQSLCRPKRLLAPNDILWKRERRHRRSLSGEQGYPTANIPQLVMETPELPSVLEVALADHFLAALMTCGSAEEERVVSVIAPNDTQEVLQQLRQMYGEVRHLGYGSSTLTRRASRGKVDQRAEWLVTHRRHLTSTMRGIAQCNGGGRPDGVNGVNATHLTTRRMRNFLRIFTREVCMTFMDECCALCALRRDRVREEQPQEVRARGVAVPDEVLDPFYTQVLSRLLFFILGWTDKESARVMPALVLQVKRQLPPYGRIQLPAKA